MKAVGEPRAWPLPGLRGPRGVLWSTLLVLGLLASRLLLLPDGPWEQDEAIFAAGVLDTDVTGHRPHPPGFPGWILLGKAAMVLTGDPLLGLRIVSALLSVALVVWLASTLEPLARGWATVAAVLVALVPGVWAHAPRAFTTTPALAFMVLAAFAWRRKWNEVGWVALAMAVAVRPQFVVLAALLVPLGIRRVPVWRLLRGMTLGLGFGAAMFGWIVLESGGWDPYLVACREHLGGHLDRGVTAWPSFGDLGPVRAAGGMPGVVWLGTLWIVGVLDLRRRRGAMFWSLIAVPAALAHVLLLHHPGFPRYSVPVFLAMAPGLARGLRLLGVQFGTGVAAVVAGWSTGQALPALIAMASTPLPPEAALRELAAGQGPVVYSHGQFAFARLATMTGRLSRPALDGADLEHPALVGRYSTFGGLGDVLPGATVEQRVFEGIPRGAWDLSQRRYDRVEVVHDPVWVASGALASDQDRHQQRFRWLGPRVELVTQPGAERLVLLIAVDEGGQRSLMTTAGPVRQGAVLRPGPNRVEVALATCGEDCLVRLEITGAPEGGDAERSARLYGAWCEGPDFALAPYRVSPGRPLEALAHGVGFRGVEAPERFTAEKRSGAWTSGRATIVLPTGEGSVELVLAQPPPRGPTVEIETGAGIYRVRAGADPITVRVNLGGSNELELRSGTRAPASYAAGNTDPRQLGAILFEVAGGG